MKENCGVARAPDEIEAVQYAWVAYMRSKHRSEKPECARSTRAPGTIRPISSAEEHRISNPCAVCSNHTSGANVNVLKRRENGLQNR